MRKMETDVLQDKIAEIDSPESVGIKSEHIVSFLKRLREIDYDIHSFQIVKNRKIVFQGAASPYTLKDPHRLLSAAKPIILSAVLIAIQQGYFGFGTKIYPFFKEEIPEIHDGRVEDITVYDLLTMQTGQNSDDAFLYFLNHPDVDLVKCFFRVGFDCQPGTSFFYNNAVPHLLFTLVERASHIKIQDFLDQFLAKPLNINIEMQNDQAGVCNPVTTVLSSNGFLKFAMLFLQGGTLGETHIIDEELVKESCRQQVWTGNSESGYRNSKGYCMQLWKNAFDGVRMDGGGGQVALILPEQNMLAVFMGNDGRADLAIQIFYEEIYSKIHGKPYEANPNSESMLSEAVAGMSRAPIECKPDSPIEKEICGKEYHFTENSIGLISASFCFTSNECIAKIHQQGMELDYKIGKKGEWRESKMPFILEPDLTIQNIIYGSDPNLCNLSGGWKDDTNFVIICKSKASMGEYRFELVWEKEEIIFCIPKGISAGMKQDAGIMRLKGYV